MNVVDLHTIILNLGFKFDLSFLSAESMCAICELSYLFEVHIRGISSQPGVELLWGMPINI